jgi:hypothetical protein
VERGELTYSESAIQKLFYLFDRERMDPAYNAEGTRPARCGTLILEELRQNRDELDGEARALFDGYFPAPATGRFPTQATQIHETANFYIEYTETGPHAVPTEDIDPANGIPDYVEQVGAACEESRTKQVGDLGYNPPPASHASLYNGKYLIEFESQSSYGFTSVVTGSRTRITLHPNYQGFPPNDDPDGIELGAMRVTVAHELKHAIQRTYTLWSEGGWLELDATWMEDIVYDGVNDYYNYIFGTGSPFTGPDLPLDDDGEATTGSYEDCNWQHYQTERLGNDHMLDFWLRRQLHPSEAVVTTYQQNLLASGLSMGEAWGEYVAWNFACGSRADAAFGYGEADRYPTTGATEVHTVLPVPTTGGSVEHLAANTHLVSNADGVFGGTPEFTFDGDPGTDWQVAVLIGDLAANLTLEPMTLSAGSGSLTLTEHDWTDLEFAALIIGNPRLSGSADSYTFSAQSIEPVHIAHQKPWNTTETTQPYHLVATVTAGTGVPDPATVMVTHSVDGSPDQTLAMTPTGNQDEYEADLPAQPVGSEIAYRIRAQSTLGDSVASPARAGASHSIDVVSVFDPLESAGSWTVGYSGDAANRGVWERVIPVGTAAAPDADFTSPPGDYCFVTESANPGDPLGEADVDGGKTSLLSPVYDLGSGGPYESVIARYRRWYSNGLGATVDDTWRVYVSNNAGSDWSIFETESVGNPSWQLVSADLIGTFATPDQIQFRFVAEDQGGGSIVEAGIDDFEIIAISEEVVAVPSRGPSASLRMSPLVPNPVLSQGAFFTLELPAASSVRVFVMDARGRIVRHLVPAGSSFPAGQHRLQWDGRAGGGERLSSGIYFIRALTEQGSVERKVTLLR